VSRTAALILIVLPLLAACTGTSGPAPPPDDPSGADGATVASSPDVPRSDVIRYVALGDSYTIGSGLQFATDRWPNQLSRALRPEINLRLSKNLASAQATTIEVIESQLPRLAELRPDFVSLQVGINDVILENGNADQYQRNLDMILDAVLQRVPANRVIVVTIPDWTLTPHGGDFVDKQDGAAIAEVRSEIERFNALLRAAAETRGIAVVDISPIANEVANDPSLLLSDESHPSPKQYAGWVELIAPTVRRVLGAPSATSGAILDMGAVLG
jgi:acyl-CoA thioesterase-1